MANDSDMRSLLTLSSKSEGSTGPLARMRWRNTPLHDRCSINDMVKIKDAFQAAYKNKMLFNEFRNMVKTLLNVEYDDDDYKILFMKINTNRNGEVDWDEFVSHLILGYFANDAENQRESLQLPIMGLPTVMRSQHRHPISRICFCPDVGKDRSTDPMQGSYLTASHDGMINWWSLDMVLLRTAFSSSPHLKVRTTWVTDMVCMPDVNIIVTSSTERDLRFYDCTARTFTLKIVITSWEYMICTMYYHFHKDANEKCMLIFGDVGGNVRALLFSPVERGPFRNQPGHALLTLRHIDLQRRPHLLSEMRLVEITRVHSEWVRQVSFYASLHCLVSCATCNDSLLMCDIQGSKTHNMFRVDKGIQCFAFDEEAHILVTGGPDCIVRVWNPFVPTKANIVFLGHHAGVTCIVLQNRAQTIYSLARDRVIKVWDVQSQACLQTYIEIPSQVGERTPISAVYNSATREFLLAAIKIAVVVLDEQLNPDHTDGFTHSRAVAKVLYNPLFKVVISCGMDSIIINWDPVTGKRNVMIRDAHTRLLHGELIPVEITAACFDPGHQLLLTGARNGELKVWNFNTGLCMRVMSIEHMCEVTNCFWVEGRILAVGWNRHVTEFEDTGMAATGKSWETRHSDDVLAAAARPPLTLATATYNSELLLWKLETGQPYRRFSCTEPTLRIKMHYSKRDIAKMAAGSASTASAKRPSTFRKMSMGTGMGGARESISASSAVKKAYARRVSTVSMPTRAQNMRHLAVHAALFLPTRLSAMFRRWCWRWRTGRCSAGRTTRRAATRAPSRPSTPPETTCPPSPRTSTTSSSSLAPLWATSKSGSWPTTCGTSRCTCACRSCGCSSRSCGGTASRAAPSAARATSLARCCSTATARICAASPAARTSTSSSCCSPAVQTTACACGGCRASTCRRWAASCRGRWRSPGSRPTSRKSLASLHLRCGAAGTCRATCRGRWRWTSCATSRSTSCATRPSASRRPSRCWATTSRCPSGPTARTRSCSTTPCPRSRCTRTCAWRRRSRCGGRPRPSWCARRSCAAPPRPRRRTSRASRSRPRPPPPSSSSTDATTAHVHTARSLCSFGYTFWTI